MIRNIFIYLLATVCFGGLIAGGVGLVAGDRELMETAAWLIVLSGVVSMSYQEAMKFRSRKWERRGEIPRI